MLPDHIFHIIQKSIFQSLFLDSVKWFRYDPIPSSVSQFFRVFQGFPGINLEFQGFQGFFRTKIEIQGFPGFPEGAQTLIQTAQDE